MDHKIPLPRGWNCRAKSAILHILALSHYTFTSLLARAALSKNRQVRLRTHIDRRDREIALLQEELRIKDARMERVPPHSRPQCTAGTDGNPGTPSDARLIGSSGGRPPPTALTGLGMNVI